MKLNRFRNAIAPFEYRADPPTDQSLSRFFWDIDTQDKFEICAVTGMSDWKIPLRRTFEVSKFTTIVWHPGHAGTAVFGVSVKAHGLAQVWMLQSRAFVAAANQHHGPAWPRIACQLTRATVGLCAKYYDTIYNFIPASQTRNIRWLKMGGFRFYTHPSQTSDILMFCHGRSGETLARDPLMWRGVSR